MVPVGIGGVVRSLTPGTAASHGRRGSSRHDSDGYDYPVLSQGAVEVAICLFSGFVGMILVRARRSEVASIRTEEQMG